jgi:hypothetical protein
MKLSYFGRYKNIEPSTPARPAPLSVLGLKHPPDDCFTVTEQPDEMLLQVGDEAFPGKSRMLYVERNATLAVRCRAVGVLPRPHLQLMMHDRHLGPAELATVDAINYRYKKSAADGR